MNIKGMISTVDTHTGGEPTRIVTGGIPHVPGKNMHEKKEWLASQWDKIRRMLMLEPRGHRDMFGAIITEPTSEGADAGVIFMHGGGFFNMCGHGTIGTVTALIETGIIECNNSLETHDQKVVLDTPAGVINCNATINKGKVKCVTLRNVPSHFHSSTKVEVKGFGKVTISIAYVGYFICLADTSEVNIPVERQNDKKLIEFALLVREAINATVTVICPITAKKSEVSHVILFEETDPPRNVCIFGTGQIDRSPCGTGTCAKMTLLHSLNKLEIGQSYFHRSIIGSEFIGKIVEEVKTGSGLAIIPEITGSAHITGMHKFIMDEDDPFKYGFDFFSDEKINTV